MSARRRHLLTMGLLLGVLLLALPTLTYPLGRDQGEFATIGRGLLNGLVPYRDLWNPKPPAVFYVYAAAMALFGQTAAALRALDFVAAPGVMLALLYIGRQTGSAAVGRWAALLFGVFYFTESFWTLTQNDGLVLLPMALALACIFTPSARRALLAGALCGLVVWFKYPFALFAAAVAISWALLHGRRAGLLTAAAAFLLGGAAVGMGGLLLLAAAGALPDLIESARVTAAYTALTANAEDFGQLLRTALGFRWSQWGLLFLLAGGGLVWGGTAQRDRVWWVILIWLLAGLGIMLAQAKAYDYHWLPMLPPLALLAASALHRILQILTKFWLRFIPVSNILTTALPAAGAALALLLILAAGVWPRALPYLTGGEDQAAYYSRFQGGEFVADESLRMVAFLQARTTPGDSLFIWGFRPEVYYLSGLNPAARFIFHFPLVAGWYPLEWRQQTVDTLWAALPPYVLVLQADYMPWVTGSHEDSHTLLQEYTELNNWLIFNYERETQIGNFLVWRRKPTS